MNIFIPVLFICANLQCEFQQSNTYFFRVDECVAAVDAQSNFIINAARVNGLEVNLRATCVTVNIKPFI